MVFFPGRSYAVYSQKMMNAAIESLVQKVQCGVVINFEKIGPDPPPVNDPNRTDIVQDVNGSSKGIYLSLVCHFFSRITCSCSILDVTVLIHIVFCTRFCCLAIGG